MDDADLAAYQEALIAALVDGRDARDTMRRLASSEAARPYAAYVDQFRPRLVDLQGALARQWCRRHGATKLEGLARRQAVESCAKRLRSFGAACVPVARAKWVRDWLREVTHLPSVEPRVVARERIDDWSYYESATLAYARPLDLLSDAGLPGLRGKKVLELAFRSVLPLRLMASVGARAVGVSADPEKPRVLTDLFEHPTRALKLVSGALPSPATRRSVGASFDVILGWNALQREPGLQVEGLPRYLASITKANALVLLYDADASAVGGRRRPAFTRRAWESAGLRALVFDRDDSRALLPVARALDWPDAGEVRARYTLLRRA